MCIALAYAEMRVGVVRSRIYVMGRIFRMGWFVDGGCCLNWDLGGFSGSGQSKGPGLRG